MWFSKLFKVYGFTVLDVAEVLDKPFTHVYNPEGTIRLISCGVDYTVNIQESIKGVWVTKHTVHVSHLYAALLEYRSTRGDTKVLDVYYVNLLWWIVGIIVISSSFYYIKYL